MAPTVLKLLKPRYRKKVAMFDYDHTLVKPKTGNTFPKDVDDWTWTYPSVPETLKTYYEKGYAIVVFTNQTKGWKVQQIEKAMTEVNVPCFVYIAMDKEEHKPSTAMFKEFIDTKEWDEKKSFFVGDALGRPADWSDVDKKFAEAVGVRAKNILAPEVFFKHEKVEVKKVQISPNNKQELVIMVGYPASGKSTLSQTIFKPNGYEIVESDVLKTVPKMKSVITKALKDGKSVVVDATNPTRERRKEFADIARSVDKNIKIHCIHVATSMEESVERNNTRPKEKGVPKIAYYTYRKRFEQPDKEAEGFDILDVVGA